MAAAVLSPSRTPSPTAAAPIVVRRPAFLTARWHALAMLNYEIDPAVLQPLVPRGTVLDVHAGKTYVSVVGFLFLRTRVLGVPIPLHRQFEEVNLRFYVRREVGGEVRRGVSFIREIVPRWAIAATARWAYNEPYLALPMTHHVSGPAGDFVRRSAGWRCRCENGRRASAEYRWRLGGRWNSLAVGHVGSAEPLVAESHEQFIAEHYWGYCRQRDGGTVEYEVTHPSWCVWRGLEARLNCDVAVLYGPQFAPYLSGPPVTAFLADGSEVAVMKPRRIA
jgi:uncharacterized protein YqjF (DUF2071 family)